MPETDPLYERRRYSAVVIAHPTLRTYADLRALTTARLHEPASVGTTDGWKLRRVEILDRKSHYPPSTIAGRRVPGKDGFAHDCYLGFREGPTPLLLIASPYRLLLDRFLRDVTSTLPAPRPQFLAVKVGALFDLLSRGEDRLRATRISVQTAGEPGVALVSLSGVSPLQSGLWNDIRERVTPYGARIEFATGDDRTRVNADRLGNFFWFQLNENSLRNTCSTIGQLIESRLTTSVSLSPLRRGGIGEDALDG